MAATKTIKLRDAIQSLGYLPPENNQRLGRHGSRPPRRLLAAYGVGESGALGIGCGCALRPATGEAVWRFP